MVKFSHVKDDITEHGNVNFAKLKPIETKEW